MGEGFSYADLLCFCQYLALHRGIAAVPYPTGLVRFAIGGFLADTEESKQVFKYELEDGFTIFMKYWTLFAAKRLDAAYKEVESHTILDEIFAYTKIQEDRKSVV